MISTALSIFDQQNAVARYVYWWLQFQFQVAAVRLGKIILRLILSLVMTKILKLQKYDLKKRMSIALGMLDGWMDGWMLDGCVGWMCHA